MWYTTRYEGFDDPKRGASGEESTSSTALSGIFASTLRSGCLLKVVGLTGLILTYYIFQGQTFFTYDLSNTTEEQRSTSGFQTGLVLFSLVYLLGALYLLTFQATLADDASWARGYCAGAKLLGHAVFLDVLSCVIQLVLFVHLHNRYDKQWWFQLQSGGSLWLFTTLARVLNAMANFMYAGSLFLLEIYHDQGTNDWHALLNAALLQSAGIAELAVLITGEAALPVALMWIALVSVLVWAMAFEQEVNVSAPLLNEPELTNEVEAQVAKFARAPVGGGGAFN